jgi:hypothetical protein
MSLNEDKILKINPATGLPVRKVTSARKGLGRRKVNNSSVIGTTPTKKIKTTALYPTLLKPASNFKPEDIELAKKKLIYKEDPIKFIEEAVKLPEAGNDSPMKLYPPQKKVLKSFFTNHHLVMLKSRQIGMSTLVQAIIVYICVFHKNCIIGVLS